MVTIRKIAAADRLGRTQPGLPEQQSAPPALASGALACGGHLLLSAAMTASTAAMACPTSASVPMAKDTA